MQKLNYLLKEFRALRISLSLKFIIATAAALVMAMGVSLYLISKEHEALVYKQLDVQAKVLFTQIVITRKWIASHGGVFVAAPSKGLSPFLSEPEITDIKGRKYVKKSPAMVTKELSEYAKEEGTYWFNITSLKLINPENAPDDFEKAALQDFEERGYKEAFKVEKIGPSYFYRYIAPLYISEECLKCHSHQGYKAGDVRGAISIALPMDHAISMITLERRGMIASSIATIGILMLVLYIMMKELVLRPVNELNRSMREFSSGRSPETSVIRTGDELEVLSRSFVEMSRSLSEYHSGLEEKVRVATKSLEQANARLTELNKKKSDFIAEVSHELRTPLTSIKGAMDYLSSKLSMSSMPDADLDDITDFFDVIRNNADRLIRMVNDTLDLERIESGVIEMHFSDVSLGLLIKDVITGFHAIAGKKGVAFKVAAPPDVVITADEDMIRQVFINLISNALSVSPENSGIEITVSGTDEPVTIYIKDNGRGIAEDEKERIFDKYYTKRGKGGTGLGLAICKGIIEAHKGKIGVFNNEDTAGSTFYFSIPHRRERD
ncbi:MAG: DUF3365 domain-containing protein [Thermodesulfovibrionia bacterium]|nr:DUF3365 domain-containing protein [Thermodesulfovibrionia bacterium]